jgi:processive 1,2-diacylglycerol beta-glucosyltransferase
MGAGLRCGADALRLLSRRFVITSGLSGARVSTERDVRARIDVRRVLILSSHVGEGHIAAARALAADIVRESANVEIEVNVIDALSVLGLPLRFVLRDAYRWQLRRAPWMFGLLYSSLVRNPRFWRLGEGLIVLLGRRRLRALLDRIQPDVVVSTYPAATTLLGHLRGRGDLGVPAYATITDLGGLVFWAHPGIDLHLVMSESSVTEIDAIVGDGSSRCVRPLIAPAFFEPRDAAAARRALGLPAAAPIVVVSGGGWGVGDIEGAALTALKLPGAFVVCLAGRDEATRRSLTARFAGSNRVRVHGFIDGMSDLLAAADALIHSTGGVTVLEASVRGCPTVAYGAPRGHLGTVTREMAALGLVEHASSPDHLLRVLEAILGRRVRPVPARSSAPSAASIILAAPELAQTSTRITLRQPDRGWRSIR